MVIVMEGGQVQLQLGLIVDELILIFYESWFLRWDRVGKQWAAVNWSQDVTV